MVLDRSRPRWLVALAALFPLACGPAAAETLQGAVRTTVLSNPEIGSIRSNRRAVDAALRAARGQYFPAIDARGNVGHEYSDNRASRGRAGRGNDGDGNVNMNRYEGSVTLSQLLFDGFRVDNDVERSRSLRDSAAFQVFDTAEAVALRAVEAYLEVMRAAEIVLIAEDNVESHERILRRVAIRSREGRGPRSDVDQATARLSRARGVLARVRGDLQDAVANYIAVVGEPPEDLRAAEPPEQDLPPNLGEAVSLAIANAPVIAAAKADVEAAAAAVGVAAAEFYPQLNLELSSNYQRNVGGSRGREVDHRAMVVARYNLFRGGSDAARHREAKQRLQQSRDNLDLSRREIEQETRLSWSALNAAKERRIAVQEQVEATRNVREAFIMQFDLGQRTLLDLLDIENELFVSTQTLTTETFTVAFGVYRTLATLGQLLRTLDIELPEEARAVNP